MTEQWQELKETIIELRDNDGTGTQQEVCKFLANYMDILETQMQEPCDELDFVQPHKKVSVNLEVCKMREATQKECEGIEQYIDSTAEPCDDAISRQAVLKMAYDMSEIDGEHFTEPCMVVDIEDIQKLPSVKQELCEDAISREDTLKAMIEQLGIRNEDYLIPAEATLYKVVKNMPPVNTQPKMGCEGCKYEKTGDNSRYPCSHCGRCYTDKYKAES